MQCGQWLGVRSFDWAVRMAQSLVLEPGTLVRRPLAPPAGCMIAGKFIFLSLFTRITWES